MSPVILQLEILHGILNNVDDRKDRSFFYLRDPLDSDSCTEDMHKVWQLHQLECLSKSREAHV